MQHVTRYLDELFCVCSHFRLKTVMYLISGLYSLAITSSSSSTYLCFWLVFFIFLLVWSTCFDSHFFITEKYIKRKWGIFLIIKETDENYGIGIVCSLLTWRNHVGKEVPVLTLNVHEDQTLNRMPRQRSCWMTKSSVMVCFWKYQAQIVHGTTCFPP